MIINSSKLHNVNRVDLVSFTAKPIPDKTSEKIKGRLLESEDVDIFCHSGPDEDTFNSAKTMANWLIAQGKNVRILVEGNLKGLLLNGLNKKVSLVDPCGTANTEKADIVLVVDCNGKSRLSRKASDFLEKYDKTNVVGFDHHAPAVEQDLIGNIDQNSENPFYIDTTAKSCSSIVYRFFEKLGVKRDEETLESLYCGMLDDAIKSDCIDIGIENGQSYIKRTKDIQDYPNTIEVLDRVESQLPPEKKQAIINHLDILGHLTPELKAFRQKLVNEKLQFTKNGNLAYIVIQPEDEEWKRLGQDTIVTSSVLNNLRRRLLKNAPEDKLIPDYLRKKLDKVKGVIVFYRGEEKSNPKDEVYKMSIHSKDGYSTKLEKYIKKNLYPKLKAGGHGDRKGGRINTTKPEKCESFINYFLTAAENVD